MNSGWIISDYREKADKTIYKNLRIHKEHARDKPGDRAATCQKGKVPKLDRWRNKLMPDPSVETMEGFFFVLFMDTGKENEEK